MSTPSASRIILAHIHEAGLGPWIEPCRVLLEHLRGLERVIEDPDELPSAVVLGALRAAIAAPGPRQATILRHQLCRLPLFEYRAAAAGEMWHPLVVPLEDFLKRHGNAVHFWRDWAPWPRPEEVSKWLEQWVRC